MGSGSREIKEALRREARMWRNSLPEALRQELSRQICALLTEWQVFREAEAIYFYYPLGSEADLLPAARLVLEQGENSSLSKDSRGEQMDFYQVRSLEEFREGAFHVMEPAGGLRMQEKAPLILVPGLAFDRRKGRVGYGKAYYDRYFRQFPHAVKAGICMEGQLAERIPMEAHDIWMDYLVTERGIR